MSEILDVYDIDGNRLDKQVRRDTDGLQEGEYLLFVDVWIVNSANQFLIQKRNENRELFPGFWQSSAIGAVRSGETGSQGARREVEEELGITLDMANAAMVNLMVNRFVAKNANALMATWLIKQDIDIKDVKLQEGEVSDAKWASLEEIKALLDCRAFVPVIKQDLEACAKALGMDQG